MLNYSTFLIVWAAEIRGIARTKKNRKYATKSIV
jgi:hypothetical protein